MKKAGRILKSVGIAIGTVAIVAIIATLLTDTGSQWYTQLKKPDFQPPDWVFAVAWPVIYLLSAAAVFLLLNKGCGKKDVYWWFGAQGIFHLLWVLSFFRLHLIGVAMLILVLYLATVLITAQKAKECIGAFSWLFLPHVLWLLLAAALNYVILLIN